MQKSTILFLISFWVLLTSCATNTVVKDFKTKPLDAKTYSNPYFSNPEKDYVYKANILVYGNELSGIFIAKKINETTHRVVFTTEFGNKLLDIEISENDFKINSIVDALNRKMLINTLKTDFRLLLKKQYVVNEQLEDQDYNVFKSEDKSKFNYLFISKKDNNLIKIVRTSERKEKINIIFTAENNTFAHNISIQHRNIKLKIELNYLKTNLN
jgi:hypothetical protein